MTKEIREIVHRLFPDLSEDEQEELVDIIEQCVYQFGVGVVCKVGKVALAFSEEKAVP